MSHNSPYIITFTCIHKQYPARWQLANYLRRIRTARSLYPRNKNPKISKTSCERAHNILSQFLPNCLSKPPIYIVKTKPTGVKDRLSKRGHRLARGSRESSSRAVVALPIKYIHIYTSETASTALPKGTWSLASRAPFTRAEWPPIGEKEHYRRAWSARSSPCAMVTCPVNDLVWEALFVVLLLTVKCITRLCDFYWGPVCVWPIQHETFVFTFCCES